MNFNKDWKFLLGNAKNAYKKKYNDRTWKNIDLPHDWVISQGFNRGPGGWTGHTMQGYFAWEKRFEQGAPADFSAFTSLTTDAIALARSAKTLIAYYGGQCWYRIFVRDVNSGVNDERNVVRRNHIYSVNIIEIRGPGIGDPNEILKPGVPIEELDTYVTADITILPWHMVDQEHIADLD